MKTKNQSTILFLLLLIISFNVKSQSVQQKLNNGITPLEIYLQNNSYKDSLYGKTYQGGLIFYFDPSTSKCLIALPYDIFKNKGVPYSLTNTFIGATDSIYGLGLSNTTKIVQNQGIGLYAAYACDTLNANGYSDWYLPDIYELQSLNRNLPGALDPLNGNYKTSTEYSIDKAWLIWPVDNNAYLHYKHVWGGIRPIRIANMGAKTCDNQIVFKGNVRYGILYDIDSNIYRTVKIGNQEWMAENLRTSRYADGSQITEVLNLSIWQGCVIGARCYAAFNNANNCPYGKLYNFLAVTDSRGLCPTGWHIPTQTEFDTLNKSLQIGTSNSANVLKGLGPWVSADSISYYNASGLTALPAGIMPGDNNISYDKWLINQGSNWWTSTVINDTLSRSYCLAYYYSSGYDVKRIFQWQQSKKSGLSIRCVKN